MTHNGFPVYVPEDDPDGAAGAAGVGNDLPLAPSDLEAGAHTSNPAMRLEGLILRSQLLVLLQRRHFCDARGRPVGRDHSEG